ncbi:hypothetical protein D3C76_1332210 [compost metagenome]
MMAEIRRPLHKRAFFDITLIERTLLFKAAVPTGRFAKYGGKRLAGMRQVVSGATGQCGGDKPIVVALIGLGGAGLLTLHFVLGHQRSDFEFSAFKAVAATERGVVRGHFIAEDIHAPLTRRPRCIEQRSGSTGRPPRRIGRDALLTI